MSDHSPECPRRISDTQFCICDRLRACEARVREDCNAALTPSLEQNDPVLPPAPYYDAGVKDGYAAALDAALDAVAALLGKTVPPSDGVTDALAAIDALEKP